MRLDKYLKVSRIIKRRTVAKEASENARILVNDKIQKPGYKVKINDIITIRFGLKTLKVKVLTTETLRNADDMYEIIEEIKVTT